MKDLQYRIDLEAKYNISDPAQKLELEKIISSGNYTLKWFPTPLENCTEGYTQRPDNCALHMYNWSSIPVANVMGKEFQIDSDDIGDLFENYVDTIAPDDYTSFVQDANTNHIYLLQNPGVPVTIVYDGHLKTEQTFTWHYDPKEHTSTDNFAFPNITTYTQGDGTVPVTSSLLPGMKWSWEFENNVHTNSSNPKPVKFVEFCSIYNNKVTIYDKIEENETYQVNRNEYIGIKCDCMSDKNSKRIDGDECNHSVAVSDSNFVRLLANSTFTNQRVKDLENTGAFILSDTDLKIISKTCPAMNLKNTIYFGMIHNLLTSIDM